MQCPHRAVVFTQYAGAATPACKGHASQGRPVEAIARFRRCEFDADLAAGPSSTFAMVIAEAVSHCVCGAHATLCTCCALHAAGMLRPLARAGARREPLARQA